MKAQNNRVAPMKKTVIKWGRIGNYTKTRPVTGALYQKYLKYIDRTN